MKVLYFGIYNPEFSRNRIYMKGLRQLGIEVTECRDNSNGFRKYWRLWKKHRSVGAYDVLIVGYPGHLVVPLAKLLSRKPVIADLLGSLADAEINSRNPGFFRRAKSVLVDWLAVRTADTILLESEAQRNFFVQRFGPSRKYSVLYTGADNELFYCDEKQPKSAFIVLFRGRLTPESGIAHVLEAARLLKAEGIRFRIIGFGQLLNKTKQIIARDDLTNVELIEQFLSDTELRKKMCECTISLGQFEENPRLSRTIPHKAFESLAMGMTYLSGDTPAIREIGINEKTAFFVPLAAPKMLAAKIHALAINPAFAEQIGLAGRKLFKKEFSPEALAEKLSILFNMR